jgi:type II secretory pathway component GspD/PulD (secretin)
MNRLNKGVLFGKIQASVLATVLLASTMPAYAASPESVQDTLTSIKTLPPLAPEAVTSAPESSAGASGNVNSLVFTPGSDKENALAQLPAIPPAVVAPGAPVAVNTSDLAKPVPAQVPQASAPELQTAQETAPAELTPEPAAPAAVQDPAAPAAVADPNAPELRPEAASSSTESDGAQTVTSAETSEPAKLDSQSSNKDGAQLAQASPGAAPAKPLDPAYRKLPGNTGSVVLKRPFKLFASNQLIRNLSFRDTPVREVIAEIARRGNLNVIIDKSVVGKITGELHDVTLNEAMDSVLSSAGFDKRVLDNGTVILGSPNALYNLGLNRPLVRAFKLSYASPFDVATILYTTIFNKGILPDFTQAVRNRMTQTAKEAPSTKTAEATDRSGSAAGPTGGAQITKSTTQSSNVQENTEDQETGEEVSLTTRPDTARTMRGTIRMQIQEGTGFNNAATDPGSQTIRTGQAVVSDFNIEQNGGGAIVSPDAANRQVFVAGTQDDLQIAEEAIRLIDRRPKQIHIQSSLVELTNQGIRQLGAALNLQGEGASSSILGGSGAPLINFLPGLGSPAQFLTQLLTQGANTRGTISRITGIPPIPSIFNVPAAGGGTYTGSLGAPGTVPATGGIGGTLGTPSLTTALNTSQNFTGFIGSALPLLTPTIAGVQAVPAAQSGFNFLTLSKEAGGRANIATVPTGVNLSLNLVLQTNKAKVLANPSVTVQDNTESLITLANEVVHKVTTTVSLGVVSTNVELVKAGIFLNVLPQATEDGFIVMRLRPQVSSPLGGPQIFANGGVIVTLLNVREVMSSSVRVKDGQTLVIGGLFTEQESATLAKVPYLAEAPILGALFRNSVKGRNRTELLLMITPKIVEEQPNQQVSEGSVSPTL